jgi:hypothetical protein
LKQAVAINQKEDMRFPEKIKIYAVFCWLMGSLFFIKADALYSSGQDSLNGATFDEMKIKYTYSEYPGGHTWPVWRNNLHEFAQLLFN